MGINKHFSVRHWALLGAATAAISSPAFAQSTKSFDIPAQPLGTALEAFGRQSGATVMFDHGQVAGQNSTTVRGTYTPNDALVRLLGNSGLSVQHPNATTFVVSPARRAEEVSVIEEVVVTAQKRAARLIDVPISITAETGAQLRRRGATNLQDIVATTAGLSNPGQGGGNMNLVIRGVTTDLSTNLKQSTVSVLFDDVPVDPATAGVLATNLRIVDVERVEVLRGPQGTLFGSGSVSGAVRYITNKPDATQFSGAVEGTFAGTKTGAGSRSGSVVLNVPLVTDRVALRAVGYHFDEGGWVDNITLNKNNVNRTKTSGGRIALRAQATDRLLVTLTGTYQDSHDYSAGESLTVQPAGYKQQVTTRRDSPDNRLKNTLANVGLTYDFGGVTLFSSSTYIRRDAQIHQDFGYYSDFLKLTLGLPGLAPNAPTKIYNTANIYTQELRLASDGSGPFRWTLGGFYLRSSTPRGGQITTLSGLMPFVGTNDLINVSSPGRQEEIAGFGEATYTLDDKLDLTAGLRVSKTTLNITSISSGLLVTGGASSQTFRLPEQDTAINPRFSVRYHPNRQVSLYAQAARGYRVGGANLTAGLGGPGIPLTYGSDHLWNYEVGAKTSLLDGRLQINGDVYYIDWSDLQASLVSSSNFGYTGNAGAARLYGLELEATGKPASWLELGGALTLNNAALSEDTPTLVRSTGVVGVHEGDRLPGSPRVQGSAYMQLNSNYKDNPVYIRASGQYVGSSYTDFDAKGIRLGDYSTFDLRAGIVHGDIEFSVFGRNLFNSAGIQSATQEFKLGPILAAAESAFRLRPRTVGVTGRLAF